MGFVVAEGQDIASVTVPYKGPRWMFNQYCSAERVGSLPATTSTAYAGRGSLLTAFDHLASGVTRWCGSPLVFCLALATVLLWAMTGPLFGFSENWQLVINTGTTIVTFLMVFLIQQSQNKDSVALHLKLNELLAANRAASNRMIGIEQLDEQDLKEVAAFYSRLAERAKLLGAVKETHSIDEDGMPIDPARGRVTGPCPPNGLSASGGPDEQHLARPDR